MSKISKRSFLVTVAGFDGFWAQKQGGGIGSDVTRVFDGGNPQPDLIGGYPSAENITVTRPFDPDRDGEALAYAKRGVGSLRLTVSITPTDADMVATGRSEVYSDALLVKVTPPDTDASSSDAAMWELELAPGVYV